MDLNQALTEIKTKAKNQQKGWMACTIGYKEYLVPYDAGVKLIQALENVMVIDKAYSTPSKVGPADRDDFKFMPMHDNDYIALQLSQLMQISFNEAREALYGTPKSE
jgi:chromosome condensin MukBEF ATPase and DNA-binding subunit MukB